MGVLFPKGTCDDKLDSTASEIHRFVRSSPGGAGFAHHHIFVAMHSVWNVVWSLQHCFQNLVSINCEGGSCCHPQMGCLLALCRCHSLPWPTIPSTSVSYHR